MNQVALNQPEPSNRLEGMRVPPLPATRRDFEIVETMLSHDGIRLQALHLDRMAASARYFRIPFRRDAVEALVAVHVSTLPQGIPVQVCLQLATNGKLHMKSDVYTPAKRCGRVRMAEEVTSSEDVFLSHQTTRRELYDRSLPLARLAGLDDVLFCNDKGEVTEGAVHSVFIKRGKALLTPPVRCGVLPGVYRRFVLETHPWAQEKVLRTADLRDAEAMYLTSSMAGMYPVQLVE